MIVCDQRGCPARAIRQITFDNGLSLWACGSCCATWFPDLPAKIRFEPDHVEIVT